MSSKPIKTLRKGRVQLACWENTYDGVKTYSYSIKKTYKDKKKGEWKETQSFSITDLMDVYFLVNCFMNNYIEKNSNKPVQQPTQHQQNVQAVNQTFGEQYGQDENIPF
jgi:hypothetical protein